MKHFVTCFTETGLVLFCVLCHNLHVSGHFRSIFVRPEGWNVRGGGHVRTPDGHHQERVQDQDRPLKRSQSCLQRRTIHVQKSKSFLAAFIFRQMTKAFVLVISDCKCVFTIMPPKEQSTRCSVTKKKIASLVAKKEYVGGDFNGSS